MQRDTTSILVVDDNHSARYAIARSLRSAGYKTMEASSGAEALEFADYVAAVVLDLHLPDLLGWEVCRLLRAKASTATLPIVHVTAKYLSEEDKAQSLACGADTYFAAPVDPQVLVSTLDGLIARGRQRP
jgi:DNA-binding response OmpR family regulator